MHKRVRFLWFLARKIPPAYIYVKEMNVETGSAGLNGSGFICVAISGK